MMDEEENWLDPLKDAIKNGEKGPFVIDPKERKVVVLGAGMGSIGGALLREMRHSQGLFPNTEEYARGLRSKVENLDCIAELGSPVEGKRLRSDGRRELMMNNAGTMAWPAPKQRRGRR
ncbi:hypothetical protein CF95_gp093 [Erwinia phage PhiEaH1]|uniref:Uncharacterized protein n=1 Tax=Erwinia phage PhiEaH1 TaxID=1401669 RepID=W8CZX4_9CAUD|nr:hypothetical protein CF95_gp093 [Erwinia phage PhiEaH1]AGX01815.1 hypothetical protein [Erwinia phage PhiEaH1]